MILDDISRRNAINSFGALTLAALITAACDPVINGTQPKENLIDNDVAQKDFAMFAALERKSGGRLGVAVLNTATGATIGLRAGERFAMCSTFKLPLCAVILREADQGRINLDERLTYTKADLIDNSPVTAENVDKGNMTIADLCEATQTTSDNVAANLLIKRLCGPAKLTEYFKIFGDTTTRVDRIEPEMNRVLVGGDKDTTTPAAMTAMLQNIFTTDILSPTSRERLIAWAVATKTGKKRLRAGLPNNWKIGDKTGTGGSAHDMPNRYNDVAIAWPTGKKPVIITSYYESPVKSEDMHDEDQAVLAEVGRIVAKWVMDGG